MHIASGALTLPVIDSRAYVPLKTAIVYLCVSGVGECEVLCCAVGLHSLIRLLTDNGSVHDRADHTLRGDMMRTITAQASLGT